AAQARQPRLRITIGGPPESGGKGQPPLHINIKQAKFASQGVKDLLTATATLKADYQIVPPGTDTPDARLTDPMPPSQMIRTTDKKDDEDSSTTTCSDGNGWDFDEIELGEQEDDADDDDEEDDENRPSEDESKEKENMAASPPKGASLKSAMGILSPSSFEIRQKREKTLGRNIETTKPSSLVNRMASNRDNSKGVGKETQAQSSNNALRRLQSELGLEFGATCSVNAISAEIDADLAEIKEAAQEMANTFIEVGEDAIGMVKDGISGVGSLFDGLMNGPTLETTGGA
ncbi:hypothetical protein THAOC_15785, partial [Thalassiosira oceanica]